MFEGISDEIDRSKSYNGHFSNPMTEWLYHAYNGSGRQLSIIMPPILFFICMLVSYFGNSMVILATVKKKKLHGSYNIFVSFASLGDILHQNSHWFYLINMISGNNFVPFYLCYYTNILMVQGVTLSVFMTLFVGVDRLIGVTFPLAYHRINSVPYIGVCLATSISFSSYISWLGYGHTKSEFGSEPVMCSVVDSMGAGALPWFNTCVLINVIDVVIYTAVWMQLKMNTSSSDSMRRVFKSLLAMMIVVVFGWLFNAFVRSVVIPFGDIPVGHSFFWASYCGLLVNIASTLNFFILYSFSSEYRNAFTSLLPCLKVFQSTSLFHMQSSGAFTKAEAKSRVDRSMSIVKPVLHTI